MDHETQATVWGCGYFFTNYDDPKKEMEGYQIEPHVFVTRWEAEEMEECLRERGIYCARRGKVVYV